MVKVLRASFAFARRRRTAKVAHNDRTKRYRLGNLRRPGLDHRGVVAGGIPPPLSLARRIGGLGPTGGGRPGAIELSARQGAVPGHQSSGAGPA